MFKDKVYLIITLTNILVLSVTAKKFAINTCGSEVYSIYHTQLNVPCYDDQDIDDLPIMDLKNIKKDSIFFIEASCKGGLNIRQACSVEAAAKTNPGRQVYVFFAGVVNHQCVRTDPLASLQSYQNVRLYRIHPEDFALETGLDHLLRSAVVNQSPYPVQYALELLKFVALYKFGGVYMDMDMLATRPFDELPYRDNWVPIADHARGVLSAGILSISNNSVGRKLVENLLSVLKEPRSLDMTSYNVMKEGVESICGVVPFNETKNGLSFTCHGLVLYASKFFIPVPCELSGEYFYPDLDVANLTRSFTQQLCNGFTYDKPVPRISTYTSLMKQYCPKVHNYFARRGFREHSEVAVEDNANMRIDNDHNMRINNDDFVTKGRSLKTNNVSTTAATKSQQRKWFYDVVKINYYNSSLCNEAMVLQ